MSIYVKLKSTADSVKTGSLKLPADASLGVSDPITLDTYQATEVSLEYYQKYVARYLKEGRITTNQTDGYNINIKNATPASLERSGEIKKAKEEAKKAKEEAKMAKDLLALESKKMQEQNAELLKKLEELENVKQVETDEALGE